MSEPKVLNGEAKQLTIEDPVPKDMVQRFHQIRAAQADCGLELLALEERKIQLLAANKKLREQHDRLFQGLLVERGLSPQTSVELDAETGKLILTEAQKG